MSIGFAEKDAQINGNKIVQNVLERKAGKRHFRTLRPISIHVPAGGGRPWAAAAGIRAAKTFGQSAAAVLVSSAVIQEVDWALVLGTAALAALASLFTSLSGLPELPDADGDGIPDSADDE